MEQTTSSTHNGTILHARSWADAVARKFRPYRYAGLEDPYSDVEQSIAAADAYHSAAAACDAAYPPTSTATVSTIVIASAAQQADQVTAASLAGAVDGPVLLAARTYLPSVTFDEIKRLKPKRVFVLGSPNIISSTVSNKLASMGVAVVRLAGLNSFQVSSTALRVIAAESKAAKHPVDTAYLATGHGISDSLAAAPILAKTGRPLLLVDKDSMPSLHEQVAQGKRHQEARAARLDGRDLSQAAEGAQEGRATRSVASAGPTRRRRRWRSRHTGCH